MLKIISFYLPQFHSIPENDAVWGEGFTEWDNVRNAKPLYDNQNQPRVPLDENYYNLLNEDTILWQTNLAKKNNIYGFCIYHYWFSGKLILNKPLELIRDSERINFPYCICWANESWTDAWTNTDKPKSFLKQKYGDETEWKKHFQYLLTFFQDENYIIENNKPFLVIYRPENIPNLNTMLDYWSNLAIECGFDGITYSYQQIEFGEDSKSDDSRFTYSIEYQPVYARRDLRDQGTNIRVSKVKSLLKTYTQFFKRNFGIDLLRHRHERQKKRFDELGPKILNYEQVAQKVVDRKARNAKSIAGMFVAYDDTPRKGKRGLSIQSNPQMFREYLFKQIANVKKNYDNDYLFMFAWNEWAEAGYLEPDSKYKYQYLEIIKDAVSEYDVM